MTVSELEQLASKIGADISGLTTKARLVDEINRHIVRNEAGRAQHAAGPCHLIIRVMNLDATGIPKDDQPPLPIRVPVPCAADKTPIVTVRIKGQFERDSDPSAVAPVAPRVPVKTPDVPVVTIDPATGEIVVTSKQHTWRFPPGSTVVPAPEGLVVSDGTSQVILADGVLATPDAIKGFTDASITGDAHDN